MRPAFTMAPALTVAAISLTAALVEQGPTTPSCQARLVHCNYAYLYSGSIRVISVDSVSDSSHIVRDENDITIDLTNGVATCRGERREYEKLGYKGIFHTERKGRGDIAGPGLIAVEFEYDNGRPVYKLTYACPTPEMTRTGTDLKTGKSETETFPGNAAAWNDGGLAIDPQPSTGPGMTPLSGQQNDERSEPENSAGGRTRTVWNLVRR